MSHIAKILKMSIIEDLKSNEEFSLISIPKNLMEIKKTCLDHDVAFDDLVLEIEKDPGFTSFLVKMANENHYVRKIKAISSIREVCIKMGLREVSNYAITYAIRVIYEKRSPIKSVRDEMERDLKISNLIGSESLKEIEKRKKSGMSFDRSEVKTTIALCFASNLAVYSKTDKMTLVGANEIDLTAVCRELRDPLLKALLGYVGYLDSDAYKIVNGETGNISWLDIVHNEIYKRDIGMINSSIIERLKKVELINEE